MSALLLAEAPALPLHKAGSYVAAAYIVFLAVVLIYVSIMAFRLTRNQRELATLKAELEAHEHAQAPAPEPPAAEREVTSQL